MKTEDILRALFKKLDSNLDEIIEENAMRAYVEIPERKILVKVDEETYKVVDENRVLPKTWEEYCEKNSIAQNEFFIGETCKINETSYNIRNAVKDRNLLATEEQAKAFLALMQLVRLRDCYNESTSFVNELYAIEYDMLSNYPVVQDISDDYCNHVLTFNAKHLAEQFLANFRNLIETAKELI